MPKAPGFLFILSDQHHRDFLGCAHEGAITPNLDGLAARGARFARAYTPCPICVPARAALATGLPVHLTGCWDNAHPYDGRPPGWSHALRDAGVETAAIGKLHFREGNCDYGFSSLEQPLQVFGEGDLLACLRDDPPRRDKRWEVLEAGPGASSYQDYDRSTAQMAAAWLKDRAERGIDAPWLLMVSFACPHPPYTCPERWYDAYRGRRLPEIPQAKPEKWDRHPALEDFRKLFRCDEPFPPEAVARMNRAYAGACSFMDEQAGVVLDALRESGLEDSAWVVYASDHGESRGSRGLFGKFTLHEESAGVPLLLAGPGVPGGHVHSGPVSLLDLAPTFLRAFGLEVPEDIRPWGDSLLDLLAKPQPSRCVFSEYHAIHARRGAYFVTDGEWKLHYHVDAPPRLFRLSDDPLEERDLASDPNCQEALERCLGLLRERCDPEAVDAQARRDQEAKIRAFGGREAVLARGAFANSPVPGEQPQFKRFAP